MEENEQFLRKMMEENSLLLAPYLRYLPWFEEKSGKIASSLYDGNGVGQNSVPFPVYDSTLMSFIREITDSPLMDRNYPYVYTRNNLGTHELERDFIIRATWREWDALRGILSKYVLGGRTRSVLWNEGMSEDIFYLTLKQMNDIIEFWKN